MSSQFFIEMGNLTNVSEQYKGFEIHPGSVGYFWNEPRNYYNSKSGSGSGETVEECKTQIDKYIEDSE